MSINNKMKFDHKHDLFTLVNVLKQRVTITTGVRQKEECRIVMKDNELRLVKHTIKKNDKYVTSVDFQIQVMVFEIVLKNKKLERQYRW